MWVPCRASFVLRMFSSLIVDFFPIKNFSVCTMFLVFLIHIALTYFEARMLGRRDKIWHMVISVPTPLQPRLALV